MKKISLFLVLTIISFTTKATVFTVSNNTALPGSPGQHTTIAAAMTVASNGDTILIQPSATNYGNFTVTKGLTFIGAGYNPVYSNRSTVGTITFGNGSSNTMFIGLRIGDASAATTLPVSNYTFTRCEFTSSLNLNTGTPHLSGILLIENCYFGSTIYMNNSNSVTVRNCVFASGAYVYGYSSTITHYVRNNLFLCGGQGISTLSNGVIENNIFFGTTTPASGDVTSSTFNNNYVFGITTLPTAGNVGSGNITNQIPIYPVFQSCGVFDYATNFRPMVGSVVRNAGTDGTDIGPTGGASPIYLYPAPYPLTGEPAIPQIKEVLLPVSSVPSGGTLNINVKARKTN